MTHTCLPEKQGGADLGGAQTSTYDYVGEDQGLIDLERISYYQA